MKSTFVIIVHFGSINLTFGCLDSIYANDSEIKTIVVNNSLDPLLSEQIIKYKNVILINPSENLGFAKANNLGMKQAMKEGARYLLLINKDNIVPKGFLKKFITFAENSSKMQITSPKIYFAKGYEFHKDKYQQSELGKVIWYAGGKIDWNNIYASHRGVDEVDLGQFDRIAETGFATGCCLLIPKEVIAEIGYLTEEYFLYYEDVDYSLKAKTRGIRVLYYPEAAIFHKNAGSSRGPGSSLHQYYQTRNRLIFGMKYAPFRNKLPLIKESFKFLFSGGIRSKAVMDFYLHRFGNRNL